MGPSDMEPFSINMAVGTASVQRDFLAIVQRQLVPMVDNERGGEHDAGLLIFEWVGGSYIFRQVTPLPRRATSTEVALFACVVLSPIKVLPHYMCLQEGPATTMQICTGI
jgi:hypothetical protein